MGILDDAIREHLELKRAHGAEEEEVLRQEAEALGPARREPPPPASFEPAGADPLDAPPDPDAAVGFDEGAPPPPDLADVAPEPSLSDAAPPGIDEDTALMPAAELPVPPDADDPLAFPPEPEAREPFDGRSSLEEEPPPAMAADEVPLHEQLAPEPEPEYSAESDYAPEPFDAEAAEPEPEHEPRASIDDAETRMRPLPPLDDDLMPPEPARPIPADEPDEPDEPDDHAELDEREPEAAAPPPLEERPVEPASPSAEENEDLLEETPDFLQETPEHDRLWFEQKPPRDFDF